MKKWLVGLAIMMSSNLALAAWGAIAYDRYTGRYGLSWGWGTQNQANITAVNYCASANCVIVASGYNVYLALATGKSSVYWYGASWSPVKYSALYWALRKCNDQGNTACNSLVDFYSR